MSKVLHNTDYTYYIYHIWHNYRINQKYDYLLDFLRYSFQIRFFNMNSYTNMRWTDGIPKIPNKPYYQKLLFNTTNITGVFGIGTIGKKKYSDKNLSYQSIYALRVILSFLLRAFQYNAIY